MTKGFLTRRRSHFNKGDAKDTETIQKELRVQLWEVKEHYRRKIKQKC